MVLKIYILKIGETFLVITNSVAKFGREIMIIKIDNTKFDITKIGNSSFFFFSLPTGHGVFEFHFVNFEGFFVFFQVWGFSILFLSFLGSSFSFFGVKSREGGCFALVNFEHFLFYYFEVLESSIFLLIHFMVFQKKLCEVSHEGRGDIFFSSYELWKFFVFVFWSFFNFLLVILVVFNCFLVWRVGGHFALVDLRVFCFTILKFQSFQFFLSFCGSSKTFVWNFARGGEGLFAFPLETLKVFCFGILKFQSLQFSSCHFGSLQKNLCEVS